MLSFLITLVAAFAILCVTAHTPRPPLAIVGAAATAAEAISRSVDSSSEEDITLWKRDNFGCKGSVLCSSHLTDDGDFAAHLIDRANTYVNGQG